MKLPQIINRPTRITSTSASRILINQALFHSSSSLLGGRLWAYICYPQYKQTEKQSVYQTFRSLKSYSHNYFCKSILNEVPTLDRIFQTDDANVQVFFFFFTNTFLRCLDNRTPVVSREIIRPSAPRITDDIKAAAKARNQLRKVHCGLA